MHAPEAGQQVEGSHSRALRKALPREEAFKLIAGNDLRPLLVLRECKVCNGTDDALLKGGVDNEKTFLLSRWFHCVKLPVDVLEKDHPFHSLFTLEQPEHLFVCSIDGENQDPLESQTSRVELWNSMRELLGSEYKQSPDPSLKKIASLLDKLDVVDQRISELVNRREDILEKDGPDSPKLRKLQQKLAKVELEGNKLQQEVDAASKLELRRQPPIANAPASLR